MAQNVTQLVDAACEQAGTDDFGSDSYRAGLDVLVASINDQARLNELGAAALPAQIETNLANRLRVTQWIKEHPDVEREQIEAPLFVLGLPRTGTTLLSYLLDQDPDHRSLLRWEAQNSVPPPEAAALRTDPRVDAARDGQAMLDALNPEFKAIHYEAPDGPTECVAIFSQDFKSLLWETLVNVPDYGAWLAACDLSSAYDYHQRELQLLQSHAPGRWSLKSPAHCFGLDTLLDHYPDARLVMTHRDPIAVVASLCSLVRSLSGTFTDADHSAYINAHWTSVALDAVTRVMEFTRRRPDVRIFHVHYDDLVRAPMQVMDDLYAFFADELMADARDAMQTYVDANPQNKHGTHKYDLESLGLDAGEIAARFSDYSATYAVQSSRR